MPKGYRMVPLLAESSITDYQTLFIFTLKYNPAISFNQRVAGSRPARPRFNPINYVSEFPNRNRYRIDFILTSNTFSIIDSD